MLIEPLGFQVSTVGEEMLYNPRLTKDEVPCCYLVSLEVAK